MRGARRPGPARALAALLATGAAAAAVAVASAAEVSFRTVARDAGGEVNAITDARVQAIRTPRAWRATWARLHAGRTPRPRRPRVDFARHTLVLVTLGRRRTGGHGIRVRSVDERPRRLVVTAEERAPGSSCLSTQAITSPWHVVRVRRTRKAFDVVRRRRVVECDR